MKEDLKMLLNLFVQETKDYRTVEVDNQKTSDSPKSFRWVIKDPTLQDLIDWANSRIEEDN